MQYVVRHCRPDVCHLEVSLQITAVIIKRKKKRVKIRSPLRYHLKHNILFCLF